MPQPLISQFDRKYALPIETYRQVQNITQRDAIPAPIRWEGMMCYVISEGLSYVLTAGMENSDWVEFGALVDVTVVDNLLSTSSTDALSANQGRVLQITKLSDAPSDGNTYGRLDGAWAVVGGGAVDSVFGRTGDVVAQTGDYTFAQIGSKPTTIGGYGITDFNSLGDVRWLGIGAKAADSNLLDGLDSTAFQTRNEKGAANGYTPLDSGAKVPIAYLPDSVIGQVQYQGTWAASTNTPTLANPPSAATKGHYYVASDNGTQFGISFQTGDWIISNGTAWEKVDNTDAVTSVFGRLGPIVANAGDYTFAQIGSKPTTLAGYGIQGDADARYVTIGTQQLITSGKYIDPSILAASSIAERISIGKTVSGAFISAGNKAGGGFSFVLRGYNSGEQLKLLDGGVTANGEGRFSGNVFAPRIIATGSGPQFQLNGTSSGIGNVGYIAFFESNGTTRQGYVGFPSVNHSNLVLKNDVPNSSLELQGTGGETGLIYNAGAGGRTVWTSGNDGAGSGLDADLVDGFHATQFLRSDANDIKTAGYTRYNDQLEIQFGTGNDARLQHDGGQMNLDMTTGGFHIRVGAALERWRLEQNGNTVQFGTATATNFILSSDRRLKKDIEDYTPVHIPIRWREFTWKESGERQIGTIAQETPKQFVTKGADGKLAVKTVEMLMAKVAELESRIINLER